MHSVSVLRQLVKVVVDVDGEKEIREYPVEDLKFRPRQKKEKFRLSDEEMRALKELEKKKMKDKNERLNDLQNGYMLFQSPKQFCFGIDAVLLAWFA